MVESLTGVLDQRQFKLHDRGQTAGIRTAPHGALSINDTVTCRGSRYLHGDRNDPVQRSGGEAVRQRDGKRPQGA